MTGDADSRWEAVARLVMDGQPVNWEALDSTTDPEDRELLRQFQIVATIASVHGRDFGGGRPYGTRQPALTTWGHLQVLDAIGEGAFATVYRALDPDLDRE